MLVEIAVLDEGESGPGRWPGGNPIGDGVRRVAAPEERIQVPAIEEAVEPPDGIVVGGGVGGRVGRGRGFSTIPTSAPGDSAPDRRRPRPCDRRR